MSQSSSGQILHSVLYLSFASSMVMSCSSDLGPQYARSFVSMRHEFWCAFYRADLFTILTIAVVLQHIVLGHIASCLALQPQPIPHNLGSSSPACYIEWVVIAISNFVRTERAGACLAFCVVLRCSTDVWLHCCLHK